MDKIDHIFREDNAVLESNAIAAENKLAEEKRKAAARENDNKIFESNKDIEVGQAEKRKQYELRKQELQYKKSIAELERALAAFEPEPDDKKTRGSVALRKRTEIQKEIRRHAKETGRIESGGDSPAVKKRLKKAADTAHEEALEAIEGKYRQGGG